MPFGGAGPMHAAAIAAELGIERILCPRASGVLSALGLLASERRRDTARTVMLRGDDADAPSGSPREVGELRERARRGARRRARPRSSTSCATAARRSSSRSRPARAPIPDELAEGFAAEHERRYGYRDPDGRGRAGQHPPRRWSSPGPSREPARGAGRGRSSASTRRARFGGEWLEAEVLRGEPAGRDRGRRARACSSCPRRPWCCRPAGARRSTRRARSCAERAG